MFIKQNFAKEEKEQIEMLKHWSPVVVTNLLTEKNHQQKGKYKTERERERASWLIRFWAKCLN